MSFLTVLLETTSFLRLFFQGFHRYSTDSSWHVPHFEKMLYDQAQLAVAYITAFQVWISLQNQLYWPSLCLQTRILTSASHAQTL